MSRNTKSKASSTRKALLVICAVLVVVLIGSLAALGLLIYNENSNNANIRPSVTVEAGSGSVDPLTFLYEPDDQPVVFVSGVTEEQLAAPGSYPVSFTWHKKTYNSFVKVVDTVAPTGTPVEQTAMLTAPAATDFVTDIVDATAVTVTYLEEPDMTVAGTYPVTLLLTDAAGNSSELTASLTVIVDETAPVIYGVKSMAIYLGDAASYRAGITVTDDYDENPELTVDSSAVSLDKVGTYKVVYKATDASGNTTSRETTIQVMEKKESNASIDTINAEADKLLSTIVKDGMSKKDQVKAIYNWARTNCSYANHSDKSDYLQGAYQMMTKRSGDCFNYYAVTKLLFDRLGIDNIDVRKVKNSSTDSDHYWSLVSLDGGVTWYHFDATPRVGTGDDFCLVTDAFLDAYSAAHDNCHNRDKSLYPATPAN